MTLRIALAGHSQSKQYHPGDQITGIVIATFPKQQRISFAGISFRGKIQTDHWRSQGSGDSRSREHKSETIRLFEFNQALFRGPYDVTPQTLEWPFSFTFPTHCEYTREGDRSFIKDSVSPLPPSFFWESKTFSRHGRAYIKYKLVATIDSGGLFKNHELELPIVVTRISLDPLPIPHICTHEYRPWPQWSSSALRVQPQTLKQKFRRITSSDPELKTPCIAFKAYVFFPTKLSLQQHAPIAFSIKPLRITPNDPEAPQLSLRSISLTLKSYTAMVASGSGWLSVDRFAESKEIETSRIIRFEPVVLPLDGTEAMLRDDICLAEWRPGQGWIGSFSTYTVTRDYRMEINAVVQHAETGHAFSLSTEFPFSILDPHLEGRPDGPPPRGNDGLDASNGETGSGLNGAHVDGEPDQLPRYSAVEHPKADNKHAETIGEAS